MEKQGNLNGRKVVDMVRRFLTEMGLPPEEQRHSDRTVFTVAFDEGPADQGVAQVVENAERFVFHFIFPGYVPIERRPKVAEFIARANWHLIEGNFQLDFETGALRFKVGIDFSSADFSEPFVRNAILDGMETIETYAEGLTSVIKGGMEPKAAYQVSLRNDEG